MGVIMGIIWFVTGMHWAFALGYLIMAIVADFVAGAFQFMRVERTFPKITILNFGMFGFPMMARPMYCKALISKLKMVNAWPLWDSLVPVKVP